ncbi:C25 family cysteine peptidase, partial [Candidatus Marinimicrobia bacterium]|nr:C25 family cysteine peptidase [Candidatus Neomarinimicrobiota bacterium]
GNIIFNIERVEEKINNGYLKLPIEQSSSSEIGYPEIPSYSSLYLVDPSKDYTFDIVVHESYTIDDVVVFPYQGESLSENFFRNENFYNTPNIYPESLIKVSERMTARNMELVSITIHPYSYNTSTKKLEVFTNLEVVITKSDSRNPDNRNELKRSKLFEQIYSDMIINFEPSNRQEDYQHPAILYICGGNSCNNSFVQQLFNWRHEQGYIVYTATESEVGGNNANNSEIKNYIQNAVQNWDNPPEMVGLIGDTGGDYSLPCYYHDWSNYSGSTDFDYTQLNGNDLFADVLIGRISAESSSDLANIINKTIQYEKGIYQDENWFESAALVGDPNESGVSTIITNQYIQNIMENHGLNNVQTSFGNGNYFTFLRNQLNNGILYYNYRGWIGGQGSYAPNNDQINPTYNNPFVTTITCGTGDFGSSGWYGNGTSSSEAFVRLGTFSEPKGAVAAVGVATSGTHTAYNNIVNMGIYDGIFSRELEHASSAMTNGHLAIYNTYPSNPSDATQTFIAWTNLIGDPALHLWTDTPNDFTVDHPISISQGTNNMVVKIEDENGNSVKDAVVTILQGDDIIFLSETSDENGLVNFNWENVSNTNDITLTIRKRNFRPFQANIDIATNSFLTVNNSDVITIGQNNINPGDIVDLQIPITNNDNSTAQDVTAILSSSSDFVTIVQSVSAHGNIGSGQTSNGNNYQIQISENAYESLDLGLKLNIVSSNSSTLCYIPILLNAPLVEPIATIINSNQQNITVSVLNTGSVTAENLDIQLESNNDMLNISSQAQYINSLNPGQYNDVVFDYDINTNFISGQTFSLPLKITSSSGYNKTEFINVSIGQVSISDPLGPDSYGYLIYDSGDSSYNLAPDYEWIEIAEGLGSSLNLDDDGDGNGSNRTALVSLPFDFQFYGQTYTEITVSADGWISFGRNDIPSFRNHPIPGPGGPSPMVAAFWDDLRTGSGGNVYTYSANEYLVIQWDNMRTHFSAVFGNNERQTFQMILYNNEFLNNQTITGDNEIKIQYNDFNNTSAGYYPEGGTPVHGCYATVGIENHLGNQGLQYTFNNQYSPASMSLSDGDAIFITTGKISYTLGDLNFDDTINVLDVVTLVSIVLNIIEPSSSQELASDVNGDGSLNVLDVVLIVSLALEN